MTLILTIAFWQCMKKDLDKKQSKSFIESFLEYIESEFVSLFPTMISLITVQVKNVS